MSELGHQRDRLVRRADLAQARLLRYVDALARRRPRRSPRRTPRRYPIVVLAIAMFAIGMVVQRALRRG